MKLDRLNDAVEKLFVEMLREISRRQKEGADKFVDALIDLVTAVDELPQEKRFQQLEQAFDAAVEKVEGPWSPDLSLDDAARSAAKVLAEIITGDKTQLNTARRKMRENMRLCRRDLEYPIVWIVKGAVTDPDAHGGAAKIGDTEWQFSDGPPGERGSSADYLSLEAGLRAHAPAMFHFVAEDADEEEERGMSPHPESPDDWWITDDGRDVICAHCFREYPASGDDALRPGVDCCSDDCPTSEEANA